MTRQSVQRSLLPARTLTWRIAFASVQLLTFFLLWDALLLVLFGSTSRSLLGIQEAAMFVSPFVGAIVVPLVWMALRVAAMTMTVCLGIGLFVTHLVCSHRPVYTRDLVTMLVIAFLSGTAYASAVYLIAIR